MWQELEAFTSLEFGELLLVGAPLDFGSTLLALASASADLVCHRAKERAALFAFRAVDSNHRAIRPMPRGEGTTTAR